MIIENVDALKRWLVALLSKICDADPFALAKYVLALVKKDKNEKDLRAFCLDQLEIFLLHQTETFVDLLFDALKTQSYLTDLPASEVNSISSPCNNTTSAKTNVYTSSFHTNTVNESEVRLKDEPVTQKKSNNVKSRSPVRKLRERSRSRSRELDNRKKVSLPSKRARLQKRDCSEEREKIGREKEKRVYKRDRKGTHIVNKERKSRSRSNSFDKSRSRGYSSSSSRSSRTRSRSCEKTEQNTYRTEINKTETLDSQKNPVLLEHSDIYRQKQHGVSNIYHSKESKRCQDYDEKGYCMKGDLCQYDHGFDPLSLSLEDVSVLYPVSQGSQANPKTLQPPPPPPPVSPPPLPPPPPPPALPPLPPGSYAPEAYNPEAPGMGSYWGPPVHIPPIPNVFNINEPPPYHSNAKSIRARQLVGVPTVDDVNSCVNSFKGTDKSPDIQTVQSVSMKQVSLSPATELEKPSGLKKKFDYSRLGPSIPSKKIKLNPHYSNSDCTLLLRKIPRHLNNIAALNNHFSKFGKIVNIQVAYDSDPEAALVQFMTHSEALAAYRSTDPIFNNRLIRIFWHSKKANDTHTETKLEENSSSVAEDLPKIEKPHARERSVVYSRTLKGNSSAPRTVFNSFGALKKSNLVPHPLPSHREKQVQEQRKDAFMKRLELFKKKQEYLDSLIQNQKLMLQKLGGKNKKEKIALKQLMEDIAVKIITVQNEIRKESEDLKTFYATINEQSFKTEKELLDAEMDLYVKQHRGDDIAELLTKVTELKQKASALGFLDGSHASSKQSGLKHGNSIHLSKGSARNVHSVDNRPRTILISGCTDTDALLKHFQQFGNIEKMEETESNSITVTFHTRLEAETAFTKGSKMGERSLSLSWFQEHQILASESTEQDPGAEKNEDEDEEDDEEEEDSEARSWKR